MQICVRFAFFEEQLHLPAQTVEPTDFERRELGALEIRMQVDERHLVAATSLVQSDEATFIRLTSHAPFDVHVDSPRGQRLPRERLAFEMPQTSASQIPRLSNHRPDRLVTP